MGERERHYCHPISQTSQWRFDSNLMILGFYAARKIGELRETWNILAGVTVAATFEIYNSRAYIFEQWQFFVDNFCGTFGREKSRRKGATIIPFSPMPRDDRNTCAMYAWCMRGFCPRKKEIDPRSSVPFCC